MLRKPPSPQYELEMISLEQLVPKDHLVRKVAKAIDFEFTRDEVAHLYCQDNGRPAVDPVRLSQYIDMLNEDVAKVREEKGKGL